MERCRRWKSRDRAGRHPWQAVAMFVLNDMRLDSRVQREARALATAGHEVTVYAVLTDATSHLSRERADGYTVVRVPMLMAPATVAPGAAGAAARAPGLRRRVLASAFSASRPVMGGTLHYLANWQLRWSTWARRVADQAAAADVWHAHDFNTLGLAAALARRSRWSAGLRRHEIFTEAGANSALPAWFGGRAAAPRACVGQARRARS